MRSIRESAIRCGIATACVLALVGAAPATAQFPVPPPSRDRAPVTPVSILEGTVIRVDMSEGRLHIAAGLFGNVGRTLEVAADTAIHVRGQARPLSEIHEGDRVKASYEVRNGVNVARAISVTPLLREGATPAPVQNLRGSSS